jgi:Amt family ammonium transporter
MRRLPLLVLLAAAASAVPLLAQEAAEVAAATPAGPSAEMFTVNNLWMMIATALVFIMHLGFATLETGLTRSKNTVNVLFKNTIIPAIGLLTFALVGFNLMYPGEAWLAGKYLGFGGFGIAISGPEQLTSAYNVGYTYWTDFLFQAMFAATAATIVSGAVAERVKLSSFLVFSVLFVAISYPITGSWQWGAGWLKDRGFYDFAGSTLVHSVGGWGALAGVILLGPRIGKYVRGQTVPILGHSMPLAVIGTFLLWLGWFGFNGGSVLSADPGMVSLVLMTTCLAGAAGGVGSMLASWSISKKPDLSMTLNGILAGLVGITAGADQMGPMSSVAIGFLSGVLVVLSVLFFDRMKLDDPVGALSVHLVCGIFGTVAVGLFGAKAGGAQVVAQLIGVGAVGAFSFVFAFVTFYVIKATMGLRVSATEEIEGLDLGEHGMPAYPDFTNLANSPVVLDSLPKEAAVAVKATPAAQLS